MSDELPVTAHLEALIDAYLEGEIDDDGLQQLSEELLSSTDARTLFWSMAQHVMLLEQWSGEAWGAAAARADTASATSLWARLSRGLRGPLAAMVALAVFSAATGASLARTIAPNGGIPERRRLPIGNGSFEQPTIAPPDSLEGRRVTSLPHDFGIWGGDFVEFVAPSEGIVPADGRRVLAFKRGLADPIFPADHAVRACDLAQVVDLRGVVRGDPAQPVVLELSARFLNARGLIKGTDSSSVRFMCRLAVFQGDQAPVRSRWPDSFVVATSAGVEERDVPAARGTPEWQRLSVKAVVPPSATFAIVQVSAALPQRTASDAAGDLSGCFCDDVRATLIGYDTAGDD